MSETQWDGIPNRSSEDGWHWLKVGEGRAAEPAHWNARSGTWCFIGESLFWDCCEVGKLWVYLGSCLTPSEVAQREYEAEQPFRDKLSECIGRRMVVHDYLGIGPDDNPIEAIIQLDYEAELRGRRLAEADISVQIDTAVQHEREKLDRELRGFAEAITVLSRKTNEPELTMLAIRRLQVYLMQRIRDAAHPDGDAMRVELTQREHEAEFRNQLNAAADSVERERERKAELRGFECAVGIAERVTDRTEIIYGDGQEPRIVCSPEVSALRAELAKLRAEAGE